MTFPLPRPMRRALDLAAEAASAGEVPVGAVVTLNDEIIAETRNAMRGSNDPTAHAEMEAIRAAGEGLGSARLDECTLWVTLEPCAMCAAAVAVSRMKALTALQDTTGRTRASTRARKSFVLAETIASMPSISTATGWWSRAT